MTLNVISMKVLNLLITTLYSILVMDRISKEKVLFIG